MEEKSGADAGEGEGLENEGGRIEYRSSSNAEKEAHGAVLVQLQQLEKNHSLVFWSPDGACRGQSALLTTPNA